MATRTISTAGGNSNVAATYDEVAVPGAGDDIVARADGTSGNFVIAATLSCRSFNLTTSSLSGGTYSGSVTRTAGNLQLGTTTAPPSGIVFAIPATASWNVAGTLSFLSTAATTQQVFTNGVSINSPWSITGTNLTVQIADTTTSTSAVTISGSGAKFQLAASFTTGTGSALTLTQGTLDLNGQAGTFGTLVLSSNSNTRVIAMGTGGTLNFSNNGTNTLNVAGTITGFSTTGSGTIALTNVAVPANENIWGTLRGVDLSGTSNGITFSIPNAVGVARFVAGTGTSIATFGNFTRLGTANANDALRIDNDMTVSATLTLTGSSASQRLLVKTDARGTGHTITCNGTVTPSNVDFRDITGAGSASWSKAGATSFGDALGNSGITFTTAATQTYQGGGSGNYSDAAKWSSRVPLPQDNVIVATGSGALAIDVARAGKDHDFTGFSSAVNFGSVGAEIHGSVTLDTTTTPTGTSVWSLVGRGSHTITTNGRTWTGGMTIDAVGGTYSLSDAFINSRTAASAFTLTTGTFDANDMSVTFTGAVAGFTGTAGTLNMGNGTWHFSGVTTTATTWSIAAAVTLNAEGSTLKFTSVTSANVKTIAGGAGGGKTYNIVETNGTVGTFLFSNAITIAQWKAHGTHTVSITSTGTITIAASGVFQFDQGVSLKASAGGSAATISAPASATITMAGGTVTDSTASGGATFVAYATNGGGNTGWTFNTTRTISNTGGNWDAYTAWVEGAIPTANDDVVATGTSGNLVVNTNSVARSVDFNTYVGTLSGSADLTLGTTTAPPGARVWRFSTGMTTTWTGQINLSSTHATAQTVTFNGQTHAGSFTNVTANTEVSDAFVMGSIAINGSGGYLKLMADGTDNTTTITQGTLDLNGHTLTQTSSSSGFNVNSNSLVRVLAMGTGGVIVTPRSTAFINMGATLTNFSVTGTGKIRSTNTATSSVLLNGADLTGITVEKLVSGNLTFSDSGTIGGINKQGVADNAGTVTFTTALTVAGNIVIQGNNVAGRHLTTSSVYGTAVTVTCSGTVTSNYNAFRDITTAGAATWDFSATTDSSGVGNALGNTGITFVTGTTCTDSGSTSVNWSDGSHWSPRVPLAHDDVVTTRTAGTVQADVIRLGRNVDLSGASGGAINAGLSSYAVYGNLSVGIAITGNPIFTLSGRSSHTMTGNSIALAAPVTVDALTGTYSVSDNFNFGRSSITALTMTSGTFDANDKSITFSGGTGGMTLSGGTVLMGNGTWAWTGTGGGNAIDGTGGTLTCEGSTVTIHTQASQSRNIDGTGRTFNVMHFSGTGTGTGWIKTSNTFAQLRATGAAKTLELTSGTTQTITGTFELKDGVSLISSVAGSPATISAS